MKLPEVPDAVRSTDQPVWSAIIAWAWAERGPPAGRAADQVDAAIKAEMQAYGRACARVVLLEAIEREYNPFEPDNQSEHYRRWKALLDQIEGKT